MNSYLTYCKENGRIAREIEGNLRSAGAEFTHDTRDETEQSRLKREMRLNQNPVFLLISDNFLKSAECMRGALSFITDMGIAKNICPIIVDGVEADETTYATKIKKAQKYIDYWEEEYKELRARKGNISPQEKETYNWRVMIVRRISNEIGTFMKELKKLNPVPYKDFKADNFKSFFAAHGLADSSAHQSFTSVPTETIIVEEKKTSFIPPIIPVKNPFGKKTDDILELTLDGDTTETLEEVVTEQAAEILPDVPEVEVPETVSEVQESITEKVEEVLPEVPEVEIPETVAEKVEEVLPEVPEPTVEVDAQLEAIAEEVKTPEVEIETPTLEFEESITTEDELKTALPDALEFEAGVAPPVVEELRVEDLIEQEEIIMENSIQAAPVLEEKGKLSWQDAYDAEDRGEYDLARAHYETLLEKTPYHADGHFHYGMLLLEKFGDKEGARSHFETTVNQKSKHTEGWVQLARLAEQDEDYLLAKSYYEKVVGLDAEHADAHYRLGNLVSRYFDDQPETAADYYKKTLELAPDHADAHYEYAALLSEHFESYDEARKQLEQVIEINPDHPFAYYDLAKLYQRKGKKKTAYSYYKKAVKTNSIFKTDTNDKFFKKPKKKKKKKKANKKKYKELLEIHHIEPVFQPVVEDVQEEEIIDETPKELILITGATSGIGEATARLFAKKGHNIIITGRRQERLEDLQNNLQEAHEVQVQTLAFDVRNPSAVEKAIDSLDEDWKNVDILVNNAGLAKGFSPIHEGSLEDWETMIDTNIKGLLYMTRAVSPGMVGRGVGHIINVGSSAGKEVYPNGNVYCGTKHAVEALTQGMRMDLVKHGLRVSSVSPGHVETEFALVRFDGNEERADKAYEDFSPLTAEDVAEVIYFIVTRPDHVNIQDVAMFSKQQASNMVIDRSGKVE